MSDVIAVASGKGGVGKSFFSASLAMSLKDSGKKILLVDADLGGANLHDFVGIKVPGKGIYNFLKEKADIGEVIIETSVGVDFIGGSGDVLGMAHITNFERVKIINRLKELNYDHIILDLGAGTSYNMVDFFNVADKKIMVMTPEPTSLENSYGFLKVSLYRLIEQLLRKNHKFSNICKILRSESMSFPTVDSLKSAVEAVDKTYVSKIDKITKEFKIGMILNMVKLRKELNVFYGFSNVSSKYLCINIEKLGFIPYDSIVSDSIRSLKPFYLNNRNSHAAGCLDDIRQRVLAKL